GPGQDFAHRLIASGEFALADVRELYSRARGKQKDSAAFEVADALIKQRVSPDDVFRVFCKRDRHWLAFRMGSTGRKRPQLGTCMDFLSRFGNGGWYGPVLDGTTHVYAFAREVKHFEPPVNNGEEPQKYRVRWHLVARVSSDSIS